MLINNVHIKIDLFTMDFFYDEHIAFMITCLCGQRGLCFHAWEEALILSGIYYFLFTLHIFMCIEVLFDFKQPQNLIIANDIMAMFKVQTSTVSSSIIALLFIKAKI